MDGCVQTLSACLQHNENNRGTYFYVCHDSMTSQHTSGTSVLSNLALVDIRWKCVTTYCCEWRTCGPKSQRRKAETAPPYCVSAAPQSFHDKALWWSSNNDFTQTNTWACTNRGPVQTKLKKHNTQVNMGEAKTTTQHWQYLMTKNPIMCQANYITTVQELTAITYPVN